MSDMTIEKAREFIAAYELDKGGQPAFHGNGFLYNFCCGIVKGHASRDPEVEKLKAEIANHSSIDCVMCKLEAEREASRKLVDASKILVECVVGKVADPHFVNASIVFDQHISHLSEALKAYTAATPKPEENDKRMRTSAEWANDLYPGFLILDPDGWREVGAPDFDKDIISRSDFESRFCRSTIAPATPGHSPEGRP